MNAHISSLFRGSFFKRHLGTVQSIWRKLIYLLVVEFLLVAGAANAAPFAYITNGGNATVSVVDTATNAITATVTVGNTPHGVAVNSNGSRVYVTNRSLDEVGPDTLSVINTKTKTVVATVGVGNYPVAVAVHPDNSRVYVSNHYSNDLSVIDTATNIVTATIVFSGAYGPWGIAVHPDGTRLYVSSWQQNKIYVIDTETNAVLTTVPVGAGPTGVAIHPDGSRVYVGNCYSNNLSVIDTATNVVIATVGVGNYPVGIAVHPDGSRVYVANAWSNNLSVIDTATNAVTATVAVGNSPQGVAVRPNGSRVYVANQGSNTLSVIDTATNSVTATVLGFAMPFAIGNFIGPEPTSVGIDIQPGSNVNSMNLDKKGKIPVAILSTETFDATHVDTSTIHFGTATVVNATIKDVNGDGRPDIVLQFNSSTTGIACGDTSATLTGATLDGQLIQGSDKIRTIGCK